MTPKEIEARPDFEETLNRFRCVRCQECCRKPGYVYVTREETEAMAVFLGIEAFDFVNRYCELLDRRRLVLKKNDDESCVFLTAKGCAVHHAKPVQCRNFPVKWRTPASYDYCEGMKKLFDQ